MDGDEFIDVNEISSYLNREVPKATGQRQASGKEGRGRRPGCDRNGEVAARLRNWILEENEMAQFVVETSIKHGQLALDKIPFKNNTKVKVVLIPKVELSQMSFEKAQELTRKIKGNLSNDISKERD